MLVTSLLSRASQQDNTSAELSVKVDHINNSVKVSVRAERLSLSQFYMFNIDGKLIKRFDINGAKKFVIDQLEAGIYMYEFFNKDQRLKSGKIELK